MEAGGPMRNEKHRIRQQSTGDEMIIEGQEYDPSNPQPKHLPNSNGQMQSAIGRELSDTSPYAKTHAERMRDKEQDEKV